MKQVISPIKISDSSSGFEVPVVVFVFNRQAETKLLINALRLARPTKLFVVADAPRKTVASDFLECKAVLEEFESIDWHCEVKFNVSEHNMGCRDRIVSGIDWVFEQEDRAIFLEDDCIPNLSFFHYMRYMLENHAGSRNVGMVSGNNFSLKMDRQGSKSYYSKFPHIWGWATWKQAWSLFDKELGGWTKVNKLRTVLWVTKNPFAARHWIRRFNLAVDDSTVWDAQWVCTLWMHRLLSISPPRNLVRNIGFTQSATHTSGKSIFESWPTEELDITRLEPNPIFDFWHDRLDSSMLRIESIVGFLGSHARTKHVSSRIVDVVKRFRDAKYSVVRKPCVD